MAKSLRLDEALLEAIDSGLLVPGEIVRETIFERLETVYGIKREEIPQKLPAFHEALLELTRSVANVMERVIARYLYSSLDLSFVNREDWSIIDYVNHAKEMMRSA
jgi:hypothetical protein